MGDCDNGNSVGAVVEGPFEGPIDGARVGLEVICAALGESVTDEGSTLGAPVGCSVILKIGAEVVDVMNVERRIVL